MKISEDLRMEVLTPERAVDASILLATMFADYECITRCIGLTATYYRYWSDSICLRAARLGVSTIVLNQLDQVVAACVCIDGAEDDSEADDDPEEQFHAYDAIMHRLQTRLRIKRGYAPLHNSTDWILGENEWSNWPEMPPGKMMHILMLGCSPEYQGRGLVQIICKKSMELSIAAGYEEFFMETTNTRSQKTARHGILSDELIFSIDIFQPQERFTSSRWWSDDILMSTLCDIES